MTELDKKIQKTQTDLVQSVLDAHEKRNQERVEVLISNAFKQLKISRFKPDQTTCTSLIYLARVSPKIFAQSAPVKELLRTHVRRDNAPANIKGTKNDIVLPILAANILLACCDTPEIRAIILNRLEQWLNSNQKSADTVQHLLVAVCMKCKNDQQTVKTLIEMRHHWLPIIDDHHEIYGPLPADLCIGIRRLLHDETNCDSFIANLQFLVKHDSDITGLSKEISRFIIERPISVENLLKNSTQGNQLKHMLLLIFNRLFQYLKSCPERTVADAKSAYEKSQASTAAKPTDQELKEPVQVNLVVKKEENAHGVKLDSKPQVKSEPNSMKSDTTGLKSDLPNEGTAPPPQFGQNQDRSSATDVLHSQSYRPPLYVKLPTTSKVVAIDRITVEAILTLLASGNIDFNNQEEYVDLLECWLVDVKNNPESIIYEDLCLTTPYHLPTNLRQKLIYASNDNLVELGIHCANVSQLIELLQQFGCSISTIDKLFSQLKSIRDVELIRAEIRDFSYFNQLMEFYADMGAAGAKELIGRLTCGGG